MASRSASTASSRSSPSRRVRSMVASPLSVTPGASAVTRCRSPVVSATTKNATSIGSITNSDDPLKRPSLAPIPAPSRAPEIASPMATPAWTSPEANRGNQVVCCVGEPAIMRASGAKIALPRKGLGATERPSASATSAASSRPSPRPPNASGMMTPGAPMSVRADQTSWAKPCDCSANVRTRSSGQIRGQCSDDAVLHHALVCRQGKIHQAAMTFGSRGRPRPRSAMMFFWICAVPPPIIRPRSNM